jgi:L-alanine-DL-glutamate epimerase-like enolase superfamily enzyme
MEQFKYLQADPQSWIINIRISKMGGILRSLAIAEEARAMGFPIIIGAQVGETSILTRAALTLANHYRDILLAQEGAFGTYLLERDIADSTLYPSVASPVLGSLSHNQHKPFHISAAKDFPFPG